MQYKYEYKNDIERKAIIDNNKDKYLIEEQNITEGNFLVFSDIKPLEYQLQELNNATNQILLKQEGVI